MSDPWDESDLLNLRERLAGLVEDPPPEPISPAVIVTRARRSRRRRQVVGTLGVAALVAVVAGAGFVVVPMLRGTKVEEVAAGGPAPVVRVSAGQPVERPPAGEASGIGWSLDGGTGRPTVWATAGGGTAQVLSTPEPSRPRTLEVSVLLPAGPGASITLAPPPGLDRFPASWAARAFDGRTVVQISTAGRRWQVSVFDVPTRRWRQFALDPDELRPKVGDDAAVTATRVASGRIWFTVASSTSDATGGALFSVALRGGEPRFERVRARVWDVQSGLLAWSEQKARGGDPVLVRRLDSGRETAVGVDDDRDCRRTALALGHSRIALTDRCEGADASRVELVDLDGRQLVSLRGSGLENAGPGQSTLVVSSRSSANAGCFVYDLPSKTLTRVSDSPTLTRLVLGATGGRLLVPIMLGSADAVPGVTWLDWSTP